MNLEEKMKQIGKAQAFAERAVSGMLADCSASEVDVGYVFLQVRLMLAERLVTNGLMTTYESHVEAEKETVANYIGTQVDPGETWH